jgi:hypothetical protein
MKVDIQDVLFWMDAIRDSEDRYRTLESFWKGQVNSKIWLIKKLQETLPRSIIAANIVIHGGWNGVLSSLLFNSDMGISCITSVDIDPACEKIARTINKRQEMEGRFFAVTEDMCDHRYDADIVINTSCEHITQEQYEQWLQNVPQDAWVVVQGNDYFELDEHIRCSTDIDDFTRMSKIQPVLRDTLPLYKYNRYMIIGKKRCPRS